MLFAEEPEPRPLRPVLAAGIVAAHVELTTAELARDTIPRNTSRRRRRENGRDAFGEELGKAIDQHVKSVRRTLGHRPSYDRYDLTAQLRGTHERDTVRTVTLIRQHSAWRIRGGTSPREAMPDEQARSDEGA